MQKRDILKDFQRIPGVGKSIAQDFYDLGFTSVSELASQDANELYCRLNTVKGVKTCRCMLYVFRCAIYFASNKNPDPILLNWWMWKD
ncbi:MAG: hypothetical protein S4CHLAM7_14860 [Chlamydiae bacterium]|nr:hypothetical protein [Chlamydiota bacterium]